MKQKINLNLKIYCSTLANTQLQLAYLLISTYECGVVMRLVVPTCLSVTYESTGNTGMQVYIFRIVRSSSYIEITGSRSMTQKQKSVFMYPGGLPSIERQSCFLLLVQLLISYES